MIRQAWVFLTDEDERDLLTRLSETVSLRVATGRYFRGDPALLRTDPGALESAQLRSTERWHFLFHPTASERLVTHPIENGPFAGWFRLDEVRSEVLVLVRALPEPQGLAPSRLQANTHAWFGGKRERKSPLFSTWVAEAMRIVEEAYPSTEFDWIRCAPSAAAFAQAGGTLHYLYRKVAPAPAPDRTLPRSHGSRTDR